MHKSPKTAEKRSPLEKPWHDFGITKVPPGKTRVGGKAKPFK